MPKKKRPLEPTPKRMRAYEMPTLVNTQAAQDPIRQIENEALRDLSNEYRQLRIEELISKKKRQLEKASPSSEISLQKQNLDLVTSIFKLVKEAQPHASKDDTLQYVTLFKDLMMESVKLQNQGGRGPSFFENMITDPMLFQRTQEIFNRGKSGETNTSDIAIEKLRGERMLDSKRIDLELTKIRLEQESRRDSLGVIGQILGPVLAYGGAQLSEGMQREGVLAAQRHRTPGAPVGSINPGALQGQTAKMQIACDCGFNDVMLVPNPPPAEIACPGCGKTLLTGPPPTGETGSQDVSDSEIGAQWRNEA